MFVDVRSGSDVVTVVSVVVVDCGDDVVDCGDDVVDCGDDVVEGDVGGRGDELPEDLRSPILICKLRENRLKLIYSGHMSQNIP